MFPKPTLSNAPADSADDKNVKVKFKVIRDDEHRDPIVITRLRANVCKGQFGLPSRERQMSVAMRVSLQRTYTGAYQINIVIMHNQWIRWWKGIAFTEGYVKRKIRNSGCIKR